jgi:hypothetical protein
MADWLEIANTLINLQNQQRLGDISRVQQQTADQVVATEYRKQRDNAFLSQLVDVVVKVRQCLQDQQFLDALLSAGVGVIAFSQLYPQIVDADAKLKASDIQIKLLETMRSSISDPVILSNLQVSLSQYLSIVNSKLQDASAKLKQEQRELCWLDPKENWEIDVGEELTPTQNVIDLTNMGVIFQKGVLYKVVSVNTSDSRGFYLINDYGNKWYLFFGKKGGADLFAFFYPPLPSSLEKEIAGWELCDKIFSDEFLLVNLKSVRTDMLNVYTKALDQAKLTKQDLLSGVSKYRQIRQIILNRALKTLEMRSPAKVNNENSGVVIGVIIIAIMIILFFFLGHC